MEFLNTSYTMLEIYPKNENPSNEEDINDNSHWIQISKSIIDENPEIIEGDLDGFIEKLNELFNGYSEIIKTNLSDKYPESISDEFADCFKSNCDILNINLFVLKYDNANKYSEYFSKLLNIITITDYVSTFIPDTKNKILITFTIG